MTRVAAYDCGTNSLRLLVADLDAETGRARELVREMRIVRLGEGVDQTGRIGDAAMRRVLTAVDEFATMVDQHDVAATVFAATSAARDAENAVAFTSSVEARVGVPPVVLTGEQEAQLSFTGAVRSLRGASPAPYLVVDVGGGSTEFILGSDGVEQAQSLDIGSVRITERHLHSDPPTRAEIEQAVADIDAALDTLTVDLQAAVTLIGVAGTVTTIAAGALRLPSYQRDVIHHAVIDKASAQATVNALLAMDVQQRLALGYLHPGRADVIGAGGLILDRLLRRTPVHAMLISEQDILDGLAWSALDATTSREN